MRRILAGTFVLALLAVAFAGPPIDYEISCGEGEAAILIGVLSLTEGKVHVALVEGSVCAENVFAVGPDDAPAIGVGVDWTEDPPVITVTVDEVGAEAVDLVVVPPEAVDGMLNAQRLRTAAMEMRREAAERGEADRDRDRSSWDDEGAPGDGEPEGPPADVPPGDGPGGPPDDAPRGDGSGEGPSGPPADVPPGEGQGPGSRP
jgi:hypothetical protein